MNSPSYSPPELPSYHLDSEMKRALSYTWHVLEQTPPPSLREILGAYNAKGDGDREMLLAMLQAKSAEDQRLASVAALHRQVLEIYNTSPSTHLPQLHIPLDVGPSCNYAQGPLSQSRPSRTSRSPPLSSPSIPPIRDALPMSSQPPSRKRHRSSRSPPPPNGAGPHEFPPSPRSDSAEYSPRSRGSMAIGSLLSSGAPKRDDDSHAPLSGPVSAERMNPNGGKNERAMYNSHPPSSSAVPLPI